MAVRDSFLKSFLKKGVQVIDGVQLFFHKESVCAFPTATIRSSPIVNSMLLNAAVKFQALHCLKKKSAVIDNIIEEVLPGSHNGQQNKCF